MSDEFFKHPVLNSPYEYPRSHWELDESGQPTGHRIDERRRAEFITPVPKPRKQKGKGTQTTLEGLDDGTGISSAKQQYAKTAEIINALRQEVDAWRALPDPASWLVTPESERLLKHWRGDHFTGIRPFFCQVEAVEIAIWLTEVAPQRGKVGQRFLDHLKAASDASNPGLLRLALKLATGAGKTTVMAMLIAWQTVNSVRRQSSKKFTRGFLLVAPGLTIKDRLRVLLPSDPDSYYKTRSLVPEDMLLDLGKAKVVITNYHALKLREKVNIAKGNRALLEGRHGDTKFQTLETEGEMIRRVMDQLMGMKNVLVINDEAHHCYREKPPGEEDEEEQNLKGDDKEEAEKNREAARVWINGLEIVKRQLGITQIVDLSATPFFLRGSGYHEGTLFPWTMSDFSLMDAIECGIVKLPRVPVADNIPGVEVPVYRNLWENIRKDMPRKSRGKGGPLDPNSLPQKLKTALQALYGHYEKVFRSWQNAGIAVPPCFIVVCNNTATSKLVYDYISGSVPEPLEDGTQPPPLSGALPLFSNFDEHLQPYPHPRALLIDSEQLESGEALDPGFRDIMAPQIERYKRELVERHRDARAADNISDSQLLREVMNTVGKRDSLGASIRCVVSVSMLTEGWDANTVTHVLGVRAFGTQLLCEQVIGRALRRQSYELNEENLFTPEYADVLGIPFEFNAKPVIAEPQPPRETIVVKAVSPDRDHLEIRFPRVAGYRKELPDTRFDAQWTPESHYTITPADVGPSQVINSGIIGETAELNIEHLKDVRKSSLIFGLTNYLIRTKYRDDDGDPRLNLFGQLKPIVRDWIENYLHCEGGTYPALLAYPEIADNACGRIVAAIHRALGPEKMVQAVIDPYNSEGSTRHVRFTTTKTNRYAAATNPPRCHINWAILDSDWEGEFCRIADSHSRVRAWVKNHNLGLEVPYRWLNENRRYIPDFILQVDDGRGEDNLLNLVVEIKGYRGEDAKAKKDTIETYWIPGVNNLRTHGRWAFAEFTKVWELEPNLNEVIEVRFNDMIEKAAPVTEATATNA